MADTAVVSGHLSIKGIRPVTMRSTIALLAALVIAGTAPALALPTHSDTVTLAAARKTKHVVRYRRPAAPQGEIACGPSGCHRIPPNCHIRGSVLDWHGNPTGADAVYCR